MSENANGGGNTVTDNAIFKGALPAQLLNVAKDAPSLTNGAYASAGSQARGDVFSELSRPGLRQYGGRIIEEFLPELQGERGARVYREMRENDALINAVVFAVEMFLRQVPWWDEPADDSDEAAAWAEFATECRNDMSQTWEDVISEILSMLVYGWSFHEMVFKVRGGPSEDSTRDSKHNDGKIGLRKLAPIDQESLSRWHFDPEDESLLGLFQRNLTPIGGNAASMPGAMSEPGRPAGTQRTQRTQNTSAGAAGGYAGMPETGPSERYVPIEKALLFRTQARKRNPEGRSILRGAYRSWYFKKRLEEIEGIGVERDLAGLPQLQPPENTNLWDRNDPNMVSQRRDAEKLVRGIRRDEMEGVVIPHGWTLTLTSSGGRRQIDVEKIIERYDRRIAMVVLADVILIGHESVGSYALTEIKQSMLATGLEAWVRMIKAVIQRFCYPRLLRLNGCPEHLIPELQHGEVTQRDLEKLGDYITKMVGVGALQLDDEMEAFVREQGGLPPKPQVDPDHPENADVDDADDPDDPDDDIEVVEDGASELREEIEKHLGPRDRRKRRTPRGMAHQQRSHASRGSSSGSGGGGAGDTAPAPATATATPTAPTAPRDLPPRGRQVGGFTVFDDDDDPFGDPFADDDVEPESPEDRRQAEYEARIIRDLERGERSRLYEVVMEMGGLKTRDELREEYREVPNTYKRRDGMWGDEMAEQLAMYYPEFGVESEDDLIQFLAA